MRIAGSEMADLYTEEEEMVSAKAKTLVARTIQLAIRRLNRTDFKWADIPSVVPEVDRDKILDEASRLYTDVKVPDREREFVRENMILELTADAFLDKDVATDIWEEIEKQKPLQKITTPEPEVSDEEESLASSIDTSGDDVEPEHLADIHRIEARKLATGKTKKPGCMLWTHQTTDWGSDGR